MLSTIRMAMDKCSACVHTPPHSHTAVLQRTRLLFAMLCLPCIAMPLRVPHSNCNCSIFVCFLTVQLKAAFHGWLPPTACIHDYLHALYMCRAFVHKVGAGSERG